MHATLPLLTTTDFPPSRRRRSLETLQINLGCQCNQRCLHYRALERSAPAAVPVVANRALAGAR